MARCGGGSHTLQVADVAAILERCGLSVDDFRTWMMQNKLAWKGKSLNDFISSYIGDRAEEIQDMLEATVRLSDELGQKADGRYLEAASQHAAL
eukprot:CAMPEP_0168697154 /NCGR_PEP_ID=MMETSP0503-20121227/35738_1 /TAXON_ID=89963 /ORGANISM="Heterocapsa rotundata, Strain SCCAP K-0483" /LENGTH=93 /DNA_ID=CAMNT_0008742971 /DNA_START=1 /DNA_END=278 /DNA_ORIENTATION=+